MTVLLVLVTVLACLGVDWLIRTRRHRVAVGVVGTASPPDRSVRVRVPAGVFFARSHTWVNLFPTGKVLVGVDDFVGRLLERPRVTLLKRAGDRVAQGEPILELRSDGHVLTVRSPLDGRVLAPNPELERRPEVMHEALFSDGWAYAVMPGRPGDLKQMLLGEEARAWIGREFARLRDVFAGVPGEMSPALLQDGGPPLGGAMNRMDDAVWRRFEAEFLQV